MGRRGLENSYLSVFCMELSMLLDAGVTPADGILMLLDDESSDDGKKVLRSILDALDDGEMFSEALRKGGFFPSYMVSMVEIGEKTGHMASTLKALSAYYDRQERLELSIKNATLYPSILLLMMVAVVLILITQVLPIFNETFNKMGIRMSPLASGFMRFGMWLNDASGIIMIVLAALIVIAMVIFLSPSIRGRILKSLRRHWGHYGIFGDMADAHFIYGLSLTLASGLDTEDAVNMAAAIAGTSKKVEEKRKKCTELLRSGNTLSESLYQAGIISARDNRMLSLGARSGMSDVAMAEIAGRNERNLQDKIDRSVAKLEPTLVIISSVLIGVILLSVMLPLMNIMTSVE